MSDRPRNCRQDAVVVMRRLAAGQVWVRLVVALVSIGLIGGAALVLRASQSSAKRGIETRFAARATLSASFVSTYVDQLTQREIAVATNSLSGSDPSAAFASDVQAFGFQAAVLLDAGGDALAVEPSTPALIGQQYGTKYAHLAAALKGNIAVSNVVASAVKQAPVVAFAVPFETPTGRRVFSGAYTVNDTSLEAFLTATTTLKHAVLYLTDGTNTVLASNGALTESAQGLTQRNPELGTAAASTHQGTYALAQVSYTFVKVAVPGTSWSLLIAAPSSEVYVSISGTTHWLPWLILGGLSLLIAAVALLAIRLLVGRRRLANLNARLVTIARTDPLTGLSNRLHLTELLEELLADAFRQQFPVCVLMIDIDHFKHLNDTYGHHAGDQALRHVAQRLSTSLREGDLLARWGGEEFLAVLPDTDIAQGMAVAQRLCELLAALPIAIGEADTLVAIQTSIGLAEYSDETLDALVDRADLGLYQAKAAGRNTVRASA